MDAFLRSDLLTDGLSVFIRILIIFLIFYLKPQLENFLRVSEAKAIEMMGKTRYDAVKGMVFDLVDFAEMKYAPMAQKMGEQKKTEVVAFIQTKFPDFSMDELDFLIELAVGELKKAEGEPKG